MLFVLLLVVIDARNNLNCSEDSIDLRLSIWCLFNMSGVEIFLVFTEDPASLLCRNIAELVLARERRLASVFSTSLRVYKFILNLLFFFDCSCCCLPS